MWNRDYRVAHSIAVHGCFRCVIKYNSVHNINTHTDITIMNNNHNEYNTSAEKRKWISNFSVVLRPFGYDLSTTKSQPNGFKILDFEKFKIYNIYLFSFQSKSISLSIRISSYCLKPLFSLSFLRYGSIACLLWLDNIKI